MFPAIAGKQIFGPSAPFVLVFTHTQLHFAPVFGQHKINKKYI
jgi:hypothetical protein